MTEARSRARRLTEIIASFGGEATTIGKLVDGLGERAFGALMFVFAVPNVIPTPPGTSAVLGLPLVILTFQLMIGRQTLWLPERVRQREISAALVESFARKALPVLGKFEKVLRPRLQVLVRNDISERLIGLVCFGLSVILFLPIPLANILPAAAIAILALALAERDGLAALFGYLLGAASVALLVLISSALYEAVKTFLRVLFGL